MDEDDFLQQPVVRHTIHKAVASAIVALLTVCGAMVGVEVDIPVDTVLTVVLVANTLFQPLVTWWVKNHERAE